MTLMSDSVCSTCQVTMFGLRCHWSSTQPRWATPLAGNQNLLFMCVQMDRLAHVVNSNVYPSTSLCLWYCTARGSLMVVTEPGHLGDAGPATGPWWLVPANDIISILSSSLERFTWEEGELESLACPMYISLFHFFVNGNHSYLYQWYIFYHRCFLTGSLISGEDSIISTTKFFDYIIDFRRNRRWMTFLKPDCRRRHQYNFTSSFRFWKWCTLSEAIRAETAYMVYGKP